MGPSLVIAIVEDHADLRDLFVDFLRGEGHAVTGFSTSDELDEFIADCTVDLLILDLNLPGEDGFSIAARLRMAHPDLQIIMLTARTAVKDRVKGYDSGADLYLTKPISPTELNAAVGSVVRRIAVQREKAVQIVVSLTSLILRGPAGEVNLTPPETQMLKAMAEAPGGKLGYWRLQELLQLEPDEKGKAALEVRISRLKKKLHEAAGPGPAIRAIWKEGYQLCLPIRLLQV